MDILIVNLERCAVESECVFVCVCVCGVLVVCMRVCRKIVVGNVGFNWLTESSYRLVRVSGAWGSRECNRRL